MTISSAMVAEMITGYAYDIGGRDIYEDRVDVQQFTTAGGLNLHVAVVADGVGGRDRGERAAQVARDVLLNALQKGSEPDVPTILYRAVKLANQAVYAETKKSLNKQQASTTLTVAVVQDGSQLFIANVGDSRVYLIRNDNVTQLTIDHTFANMMPMQGKMSWELARENPRAEVVMRALGIKPDVQVDLGFYVNTTDPNVANARGRKGVPLKQGDTVLVCSDGLTKNGPDGQPFISQEEIKRVVRTQEGEKAARSLVSFALGRDTDDNVSAALLQMPDPGRRLRARMPRIMAGGIIALLVVVIGFLIWTFSQRTGGLEQELDTVAQAATESAGQAAVVAAQGTSTAVSATETAVAIASFTPTPTSTPTSTPTPRPTLSPGEVGAYFRAGNSERITFIEDEEVDAGTLAVELQINHTGSGENGSIYGAARSRLRFTTVTDERMEFVLFQGSNIFIETGKYAGGAEVTLAEAPEIRLFVAGSCMAVNFTDDASSVTVSCYEGSCSYSISFAERVPIATGEQLVLDTNSLAPGASAALPVVEARSYHDLLSSFPAGVADADACIEPWIPTPTPTPRPSNTPQPTATQTPSPLTPTSDPGSANPNPTDPPSPPTNTPRPPTSTPQPPTSTPRPPTSTPQPSTNTPQPPTSTPRPPTNTPPPPTDTPLPPTDTPPPPTDTPVPPTDTPPPPTDTPPPVFTTAQPTPTP